MLERTRPAHSLCKHNINLGCAIFVVSWQHMYSTYYKHVRRNCMSSLFFVPQVVCPGSRHMFAYAQKKGFALTKLEFFWATRSKTWDAGSRQVLVAIKCSLDHFCTLFHFYVEFEKERYRIPWRKVRQCVFLRPKTIAPVSSCQDLFVSRFVRRKVHRVRFVLSFLFYSFFFVLHTHTYFFFSPIFHLSSFVLTRIQLQSFFQPPLHPHLSCVLSLSLLDASDDETSSERSTFTFSLPDPAHPRLSSFQFSFLSLLIPSNPGLSSKLLLASLLFAVCELNVDELSDRIGLLFKVFLSLSLSHWHLTCDEETTASV